MSIDEGTCCNCGEEVPSDYASLTAVPNGKWIMLCCKCMPYYLKEKEKVDIILNDMYRCLYQNYSSKG